jgi:hypothetical protein
MFEVLLSNELISDFLNNYEKRFWKTIIKYLVEIALLNLYNSFGTFKFNEVDFKNIINNLKSELKNSEKFGKIINMSLYNYLRENKENFIFNKKIGININNTNILRPTISNKFINYNETEASTHSKEKYNIMNKMNKKASKNDLVSRYYSKYTLQNDSTIFNELSKVNHSTDNSIDNGYIKVKKKDFKFDNIKIRLNQHNILNKNITRNFNTIFTFRRAFGNKLKKMKNSNGNLNNKKKIVYKTTNNSYFQTSPNKEKNYSIDRIRKIK